MSSWVLFCTRHPSFHALSLLDHSFKQYIVYVTNTRVEISTCEIGKLHQNLMNKRLSLQRICKHNDSQGNRLSNSIIHHTFVQDMIYRMSKCKNTIVDG